MSSVPSAPNQTIIIQQASGWQKFVSWTGWILFAMTFLALLVCFVALIAMTASVSDYYDTSHGITEKFVSGKESGTADKIAVISIEGVIMEGDGFVKHQIDQIRDDDKVKAIVVRVDSPGGTITGSDYIYHHLKKLKEEKKVPLVVSMGSMAASGGYYVSMAVGDDPKTIYAEPTTTTGSIGVIIPHYDISGLMKEYNVEDDSIASHERKQMLSMTRKLSEENRVIVQSYVNEAFVRFKDIVKSGRPKFRADPSALDTIATGEIFSADNAKENGLVDEHGFLEDAVARAAELASISDYRVVKYERPTALFDLGNVGSANARSELNMLFELSVPKGYYMATMLPAAFSTHRAD